MWVQVLLHLWHTASACFLKAASGSKNKLFISLPAFNKKEGRRLSFTGLHSDPGSEHFCTLGLGFDPRLEQSLVVFPGGSLSEGWARAQVGCSTGRGCVRGGLCPLSSFLSVPRSMCQALEMTSATRGCGATQTQENTRTPLSLVWDSHTTCGFYRTWCTALLPWLSFSQRWWLVETFVLWGCVCVCVCTKLPSSVKCK